MDMKKLYEEINTAAPVGQKVNSTFEVLNDDMYYVMMEKTDGVSAVKAKAVGNRDGLKAYHEVCWWYVTTTGAALQDKSKRVSCPNPIVKEEHFMEKLEAWEAEVKVLDQYDVASRLTDQAKLVALEILFTQHGLTYETIEREPGQQT